MKYPPNGTQRFRTTMTMGSRAIASIFDGLEDTHYAVASSSTRRTL
jgi:hypothetical protein